MEVPGSKHFHFVLVHGAGHGAWCWYKVITKLRQAGHAAEAVDLSSAGINHTDPKAIMTAGEYSAPLLELITSFPEEMKVVVVGHSYGGVNLTYLLEHIPEKLHAAIYVAAFMLPSGAKANDMLQQVYKQAEFIDRSETTLTAWFKQEFAEKVLYSLSPPEDVVLAKSLLKPFPVVNAGVEQTSEKYGAVPRFFIKAKEDKAIPVEVQEEFIRLTPPTGVYELDCDHSPFFSDVDALVACLLEIVKSNL